MISFIGSNTSRAKPQPMAPRMMLAIADHIVTSHTMICGARLDAPLEMVKATPNHEQRIKGSTLVEPRPLAGNAGSMPARTRYRGCGNGSGGRARTTIGFSDGTATSRTPKTAFQNGAYVTGAVRRNWRGDLFEKRRQQLAEARGREVLRWHCLRQCNPRCDRQASAAGDGGLRDVLHRRRQGGMLAAPSSSAGRETCAKSPHCAGLVLENLQSDQHVTGKV
jgi:hypothetical protein